MLKRKVFIKCDPSTWDLGRIWGSAASHSHGLTCLHYVQGFYFWGVGIGCSLPLCQCSYIILQPCAFNVKARIGARLWLAQRSQKACRLVPQTEFIYSIFWFNQPCGISWFLVEISLYYNNLQYKKHSFCDKWVLDDTKGNLNVKIWRKTHAQLNIHYHISRYTTNTHNTH